MRAGGWLQRSVPAGLFPVQMHTESRGLHRRGVRRFRCASSDTVTVVYTVGLLSVTVPANAVLAFVIQVRRASFVRLTELVLLQALCSLHAHWIGRDS